MDAAHTNHRIRVASLGGAAQVAMLALVLLFQPVPSLAESHTGTPQPCTFASGSGVTIQRCTYTLSPSPAGNPDYFVTVTLAYTSSSPAVRFRCLLGNGATTAAQYGVLRASGATLKFVSPFVAPRSALTSVACSVDSAAH
jgi:hypothetical protein